MLKSRDRSRSRDISRPIFDGLGLGLEGSGLGLGLGLEGSSLVNIPADLATTMRSVWVCSIFII